MISAQATDPPEISRWRRSKAELAQVAKAFKDHADALRLVVVKDMWLTDFDAPVLHTLYIDKPMRDRGQGGRWAVGALRDDLRAALLRRLTSGGAEPRHRSEPAFLDCYDYVLAGAERTRELLDAQTQLQSFYALARTQPAVIELRDEIVFFGRLAAELRKITTPDGQASPAAEQAVRQFMSEGLAAGEIADVLAVADQDRPEISVLSDEFLDSIAAKTEHPNIQVRPLEKVLKDEVRSRQVANRTQAKLFSDQIEAVLHRYELRQLSSAEVVARLVEIAKSLHEARHRHEQLGLSIEEAAFYDALAGGNDDATADPQLATIAAAASLGATGGGVDGHDLDHCTKLVLEQAEELYRYWPEVQDRLFA